MALRVSHWMRRAFRRRGGAQWAELAQCAPSLGARRLAGLRGEAEALRRDLDRFLIEAARPSATPSRPDQSALPPGTDWSWRPALFEAPLPSGGAAGVGSGTRFGPDVALWHDLPDAALIVAQSRNAQRWDLPPFALQLESFAGGSGYAALSFDLPQAALEGLDQGHVLRVASVTGAAHPTPLYLRLNIEHGPNTEQLLRQIDGGGDGAQVARVTEFDLGFVEMNRKRLQKIWLDVIAEQPGFNAIWLRDLVISRHRRADM